MEEREDDRVSAFGGADNLEREPTRYFIQVDLGENPEYRENLAARARDLGLEARLIAKPFGAYFTAPEDCEIHASIFKAGHGRHAKVVLRLICGDSDNFSSMAHTLLGPSCVVDEPSTPPSPNRVEVVVGSRPTQPAGARNSRRRAVVIQADPNPGLVKTPERVDFLCGRNGRPRTTPGTSNQCLASWPGNKVVYDFIDEHIQVYANSGQAGRRILEEEAEQLVYDAGGRFLEPVYKDRVPTNEALWMQVGGQQWMRKGVKAPTRKRPPTAKTVIREKFKYNLTKYLQTDESNLDASAAVQPVLSAAPIQQGPASALQQHSSDPKLVGSASARVPPVLTSITQQAQDQTNPTQQQGLELCLSESNLLASKGVQPDLSPPTQRAQGQSNLQQQGSEQLLAESNFDSSTTVLLEHTVCTDLRCLQAAHGDTNPIQQLNLPEPNLNISSTAQPLLGLPTRQARDMPLTNDDLNSLCNLLLDDTT